MSLPYYLNVEEEGNHGLSYYVPSFIPKINIQNIVSSPTLMQEFTRRKNEIANTYVKIFLGIICFLAIYLLYRIM